MSNPNSCQRRKDPMIERLVLRYWSNRPPYRLDEGRARALAALVQDLADRGFGDDEIPAVLTDDEVLRQFGFEPDAVHLVAALRTVRERELSAAG